MRKAVREEVATVGRGQSIARRDRARSRVAQRNEIRVGGRENAGECGRQEQTARRDDDVSTAQHGAVGERRVRFVGGSVRDDVDDHRRTLDDAH